MCPLSAFSSQNKTRFSRPPYFWTNQIRTSVGGWNFFISISWKAKVRTWFSAVCLQDTHNIAPMYSLLIIVSLALRVVGQITTATSAITNPQSWPNFSDQRTCAQCIFTCYTNVANAIGCADWFVRSKVVDANNYCRPCVCNHFSVAQPTALSLAESLCSGDQGDVEAATSILNAFCQQLPGVTTYIPLPTVTVITTSEIDYVTPVTTVTTSTTTTSTLTPHCSYSYRHTLID